MQLLLTDGIIFIFFPRTMFNKCDPDKKLDELFINRYSDIYRYVLKKKKKRSRIIY